MPVRGIGVERRRRIDFPRITSSYPSLRQELTKFFARLTLIGGAGPIVAPIVGGQLLLLTSWHGVFVFLAAFGLLLWASMFLAIPESLPRERRIAGGALKSALAMFGLLRDRSDVEVGRFIYNSC